MRGLIIYFTILSMSLTSFAQVGVSGVSRDNNSGIINSNIPIEGSHATHSPQDSLKTVTVFSSPTNPDDQAVLENWVVEINNMNAEIENIDGEARRNNLNMEAFSLDNPEFLDSVPVEVNRRGLKERIQKWKQEGIERVKMTIYRGMFNAVPTALGMIIAPLDYHLATVAFATAFSFLVPAWFQWNNTKIQNWANKGNLMTVFILKRLLLISGIYNILFVGGPILIEGSVGTIPFAGWEDYIEKVVKYSVATVVGQGAIEFAINKMRNQLANEDPNNTHKYNLFQSKIAYWSSGLMAAVIIADMTGIEIKDYVNATLIGVAAAANVVAQPKFFHKVKGYIREKLGISGFACQNLFN